MPCEWRAALRNARSTPCVSSVTWRSARHVGVLAAVVPPCDQHARGVEDDERVQRRFGTAGDCDRRPVTLRDEETAVGTDRRTEAEDGRAFLVGVLQCLFLGSFALAARFTLALGQKD